MFSFWKKERRSHSIIAAIVVLSSVGALLMAYLTWVHFALGESSICDFSAKVSCDVVNQSDYAKLLGIPVALLGLAFFLTVILVALCWKRIGRSPLLADLDYGRFTAVLLLSAFGLAFSLTLTAVEIFLIYSICPFCELSKVLMVGVVALAAYGVGFRREKLSWPHLAAAVLAGLAVGGYAAFLQ